MRAYLADAIGQDPIADPRARRFLLGAGLLFALLCFALSFRRFQTFHNHTFDLAFYARMAWGRTHFDGWQPIIGASVWGLHLVWIFDVLCWIGLLFGQVPTLLAAQALALGAAAIPLGRIAARRFGGHVVWAAPFVAALLFLHPNTLHVASGDFHPGTVAVLPLAWLMDALDRRNVRGVVVASVGVLLCREDLGLLTALAALLLAWRTRGGERRTALGVAVGSLVYVAFFALVLLPIFGPRTGSLALHFGSRGSSALEVVSNTVLHPGVLLSHLASTERLLYLPTLLAPLCFLPLLAPELLIASPLLLMALLSEFPTATQLDSHYLTPALPVLVAATLLGMERVGARANIALDGRLALLPLLATLSAQLAGGVLGAGFDARAFVEDDNTLPARRIALAVPAEASIQAPDALLAHFAERSDVRRAPPPEAGTRFVVLDLSHRRRLRHDEDLLRTEEEPVVRAWLAREDHAIMEMGGDFVLLERDRDPRLSATFRRWVTMGADPGEGRALANCIRLVSATLMPTASAGTEPDGGTIELVLVATAPCPSDLALRIGVGYRPRRVDLIADGSVSPAHLRTGDRVRSLHVFESHELEAIRRQGLRVGALRESGSPPEHGDPPALDVAWSALMRDESP